MRAPPEPLLRVALWTTAAANLGVALIVLAPQSLPGRLAGLPQDALARTYPEPIANLQLPCGRFLMHLAVHLGFHLGQAGYLRRAVTGDARTAGTVPVAALADR